MRERVRVTGREIMDLPEGFEMLVGLTEWADAPPLAPRRYAGFDLDISAHAGVEFPDGTLELWEFGSSALGLPAALGSPETHPWFYYHFANATWVGTIGEVTFNDTDWNGWSRVKERGHTWTPPCPT